MLTDAGNLPIYDDIDPELREKCEDAVLNRSPNATEAMLELAEKEKARLEALKAGGVDANKVKAVECVEDRGVQSRGVECVTYADVC
jgi:cobalamin-dependent methionine synthase I